MTVKELREKRAPMAIRIRELADAANDESRDFTPEEVKNWEEVNADYNGLSRDIERQERVEAVTGDQSIVTRGTDPPTPKLVLPGDENRVGNSEGTERATKKKDAPTDEQRDRALLTWCRSSYGMEVPDEERELCRKLGFNLHAREIELSYRVGNYERVKREFRAQSTTPAEGGFLIPEGFVNNLESALLAFGGMRQTSEIIRTATGNDLPWPTNDDTGNVGALLAENTQVSEDDLVFANVIYNAYKYTSNLVRVSQELLEDSALDLPSILGQKLGERIGRITNTHFTTGTGIAQPEGLTVGATLGVTTATALGLIILPDELFDLQHSVDPAYRDQPGAGWMMNDDTFLEVRKLKGTDDQYLLQPGLTEGAPDRLLGHPVTINQDVATRATSAITILYGSLRHYKIRDVAGFRMRRLVERYADFDQDGFVAFSRHDGRLLDAGTAPVKFMQMAAA